LRKENGCFTTLGPGAWLLWLKANFRGTARTAQRYMRLAHCMTDAAVLQGMSLRQAYARLGIATEPKTPGKRRLRHTLPAHIVLANRLVRTLKRRPGQSDEEQGEAYRRDLRAFSTKSSAHGSNLQRLCLVASRTFSHLSFLTGYDCRRLSFVGRASERRSRAFLRLMASMCRQFPDLRTWLTGGFRTGCQNPGELPRPRGAWRSHRRAGVQRLRRTGGRTRRVASKKCAG
jgi:hypothetical protein